MHQEFKWIYRLILRYDGLITRATISGESSILLLINHKSGLDAANIDISRSCGFCRELAEHFENKQEHYAKIYRDFRIARCIP